MTEPVSHSGFVPRRISGADGQEPDRALAVTDAVPIGARLRIRRRLAKRLILSRIDLVPLVVVLLMLLPPEARLSLGGFELYAYRIGLLFALPFALVRMRENRFRPTISDVAIILAAGWIAIATLNIYGLAGYQSAGALSLDLFAAYFVGRMLIASPLELRRLLYLMAPVFLFIAVCLALESIGHRYLVRPLIGEITGFSPEAALDRIGGLRLGLLRATGPFQHPITGGLVMGSLLPLYFFADLPRRGLMGIAASLGAIFCLSSAALLSLALGIAMSVYHIVQRVLKLTWLPVIAVSIVLFLVLQIGSNSGIISLAIRNLTLDPATGYYRMMIWIYGWADVFRHPLFGIGFFGSYARPEWMKTDSIDNYWLQQPLRFGLPVLAFTAIAFVGNLVGLMRIRCPGAQLEAVHGLRMEWGLAITLLIVFLLMFTVSPWGGEMGWFLFLVGAAGSIAQFAKGNEAEAGER
ncbi:hypothetical protein [Tsuneonella mangrovi]|uniref:hypothetical protein n=1 Tax=Tsuneonella mangrovi TaxID=1982042 RepID=UPI000BA273A6|nr:hypothetical protein [Tsuneonella mangrovi]